MTPPVLTFITGNQHKADYLARYLDHPVTHRKLELTEIQSLSLREIVAHKLHQAYEIVQAPVIAEDASLEFAALGGLPGPFIKYFVEHIPFEQICRMVDGQTRAATARTTIGYADVTGEYFFEGYMHGVVPDHPAGEVGYGWDQLFIPEGYTVTRAQLDPIAYEKTYTTIKPFGLLKAHLTHIPKDQV